MNYLIDPSFEGVNRLFVLSFENDAHQLSHKRYFLPKIEIKTAMLWLMEKNVFNQAVKNDLITYENIRGIAAGQGDDCATVCLLDYNHFKIFYKIIAMHLTLSVPENLKNMFFEISINPQTLNINNYKTTNAKSINLDIIRKLIEYSLKLLVKAMFTSTTFEKLLLEVLWPVHRVIGGEWVKPKKKTFEEQKKCFSFIEIAWKVNVLQA